MLMLLLSLGAGQGSYFISSGLSKPCMLLARVQHSEFGFGGLGLGMYKSVQKKDVYQHKNLRPSMVGLSVF